MILERVHDLQDEQGKKIDALTLSVSTLTERLADYPEVRKQVFTWRERLAFAKTAAGWVAALAGFGATLAGLIQLFL